VTVNGVFTPRLKPLRVKTKGRQGFLPLGCNHGLKTKGYIPLSLGEVLPLGGTFPLGGFPLVFNPRFQPWGKNPGKNCLHSRG